MLEIIAMGTMAIDHVGAVFFPQVVALRIIGRIAFPIYCYMIAQGYMHTSSLSKYAQRLFVTALVSQPIYMLLFRISRPNVIFTLLISLAVLSILDSNFHHIMKALALLASVVLLSLGFEYGVYGLALVLTYRYCKETTTLILLHSAINLVFVLKVGSLQSWSILGTIVILRLDNYSRLKINRNFYRIFYPLHLSALWLLQVTIYFNSSSTPHLHP